MSLRANYFLIASVGLSLTACVPNHSYLHAPAIDAYAQHDPNGLTILSNGRYLKPAGRHLPVAHEPYGLAMSRDGKTLFVASDETGQLITDWQGDQPVVTVIKPPTYQRKPGKKEK